MTQKTARQMNRSPDEVLKVLPVTLDDARQMYYLRAIAEEYTREYWQNILDKVDAITEIPSHRWDWRLYFDADRTAKDKIYSKWGGFLDDMVFDPMHYGMPPKSIASVDPMQLMALEVARLTIEDAGYHEKAFDRERASVIVGASGGTGDVGSQYGLRSELPRFSGAPGCAWLRRCRFRG